MAAIKLAWTCYTHPYFRKGPPQHRKLHTLHVCKNSVRFRPDSMSLCNLRFLFFCRDHQFYLVVKTVYYLNRIESDKKVRAKQRVGREVSRCCGCPLCFSIWVGAPHRDNLMHLFPLGQKCPRKMAMYVCKNRKTLNNNDLKQVAGKRFSLKQCFAAGDHSNRLRKNSSDRKSVV